MKTIFRKWVVLLIAISMVCTLFSGCSSENTGGTKVQTTDATSPEAYKPKVDHITIQTTNRVVPDENMIKTWMETELGVKLNFIIPQGAELQTKLNMLVASNEVPDIMTIPFEQALDYERFAEQGIFADLDPLLKYAPNVLELRTKEQLESLRFRDGKLYAINSLNQTQYDILLIRQDWLKKLGLKVPTTTDELTEVCRAFVKKDPDGNGKDDTIGYAGWAGLGNFNAVWGAFGANPFQWVLKNGKVVHGALQPEIKDALKYLRMLYQEGLLEKEYLTVDRAKMNEKISTNKTGIVQDQLWYADPNYSIYHPSADADWIGVAPPKGPAGKSGYLTFIANPVVRSFTCIGKNSKDPVTAIKYLNFLGEYKNYMKIRLGDEGEHYTLVNGKAMVTPKYKADNSLLIQQGITATYAMPFLSHEPLKEQFSDACFGYLKIRKDNEKDHYGAMFWPVRKIEEKQLGAGWFDVYNKGVNKLIIEGGNIDTEFDALVKTIYDKYSMAEQEKLVNEQYMEMNKKK